MSDPVLATLLPHSALLALAGILFAVGAGGVLTRRNAITTVISLQIMFMGSLLAFASFVPGSSAAPGPEDVPAQGTIFMLFVIAAAAAEAAVGLAMVLALHRHRKTVDADRTNLLRW